MKKGIIRADAAKIYADARRAGTREEAAHAVLGTLNFRDFQAAEITHSLYYTYGIEFTGPYGDLRHAKAQCDDIHRQEDCPDDDERFKIPEITLEDLSERVADKSDELFLSHFPQTSDEAIDFTPIDMIAVTVNLPDRMKSALVSAALKGDCTASQVVERALIDFTSDMYPPKVLYKVIQLNGEAVVFTQRPKKNEYMWYVQDGETMHEGEVLSRVDGPSCIPAIWSDEVETITAKLGVMDLTIDCRMWALIQLHQHIAERIDALDANLINGCTAAREREVTRQEALASIGGLVLSEYHSAMWNGS